MGKWYISGYERKPYTLKEKISNLFLFLHKWKPRKNVIYRSWIKTPFIRANMRVFTVKIIINNEIITNGSFSVGNKWCEIRAGPYKLILPRKNVEFYKKTRRWDNISKYGQNGDAGMETLYIVKVKKFSREDFERFKKFKSIKKKNYL